MVGAAAAGRRALHARHRQRERCWDTNTRGPNPRSACGTIPAMFSAETARSTRPSWCSWSTWTTRCSTTTASSPTSASTWHRPTARSAATATARSSSSFGELGYRDYLGALQRYRAEHPQDVELLAMSPGPASTTPSPIGCIRVRCEALADLRQAAAGGARAVRRRRGVPAAQGAAPGIADAVDGQVLIYIHKEQSLADVQRRLPARHYVLIDDSCAFCRPSSSSWQQRVTTLLPRQGQYALDAAALVALPGTGLASRIHNRASDA